MKRPKLKKASKRMTCAKRFKIQKKVREHHKKLRREAKKGGLKRRSKKDAGVPNSAPFKEEVLREAEERKLELERLKEENKILRQKDRAEKRKKTKEEVGEDTQPKTKKAKKEAKLTARREARAAVAKEKSVKTFRITELNKVVEASDVILEVLDARDPMGSRCPQLEEAVLKHGGKKRLLLLVNKIDLVPKDNLGKWVEYLQTQCPTLLFKSSTQLQDRTVLEKKQRANNNAVDYSRAGESHGSDALLQTLSGLADGHDEGSMLKVGVVGFPNVGKSSVINSLKEVRACQAGVKRGLTKCMQEVHISKKLKLIDSPAVVAAPSNSGEKLALRSLQVEDQEQCPLDAVRSLIKQCNEQQIMLQYNVPNYRNSMEFLTCLAKKRGFLQKGAQPNTEQAATAFLNDWTGAKLCYYSKVPEKADLPPYLTEALVKKMKLGLQLDDIKMNNEKTLKRVRNPNTASSICFNSKGSTDGLLNVSEIPKEKAVTAVEREQENEPEEKKEKEEPVEIETQEVKTKPSRKAAVPKKRLKAAGKAAVSKVTPINTDLLAVPQNNDAYDFNTDFV